MPRQNQKLYYPSVYSFSRDSIGNIVLFKCEEDLALHPFMIVFNNNMKDKDDDELLYLHLLTKEVWSMQDICKIGYDYVRIVEDIENV